MIHLPLRSSVCALLVTVATIALTAAGDPALLTSAKNGQVLHTPGVKAIFWGEEWSSPTFAGDIISGLDTLLGGYSNSTYAESPTEYSDRSGHVTPFINYAGYTLDVSAAPAVNGLTPAVAIGEACKVTGNQPDPGSVYTVIASTEGAVPNSKCAYHTWGSCVAGKKSSPIQVAAMAYVSGVAGTGCDGVQDTQTGHSLALGQMANFTMHEMIETVTDPRGTGWRDGTRQEIGDKCEHIFPATISAYPVFWNGSIWKLQGMWSNAAYLAGTGAFNLNGQPGCIW